MDSDNKMTQPTTTQLKQLRAIISKMPLQVCCMTILPEFRVRWKQVARAVRNDRLPMVPASVARVICKHAAKNHTQEEVQDILDRLKLKLLAVQNRKWHVITLLDPLDEDISIEDKIDLLPDRIAGSLQAKAKNGNRPKVYSARIESLVFISVCLSSRVRESAPLHVASPPGNPVALVSSTASSLLKHCVLGLGYKNFENAYLCGYDIPSLLSIHNRHADENPEHLTEVPEYTPMPEATNRGIDYTYKNYNANYVDKILGPKPPLLTELTITSNKTFEVSAGVTKNMKISVQLKSEDVAQTLRNWVEIGALAPTSDLFSIFNKVKCNKFQYGDE